MLPSKLLTLSELSPLEDSFSLASGLDFGLETALLLDVLVSAPVPTKLSPLSLIFL